MPTRDATPRPRRTVWSWRQLILKADPDFEKEKRDEIEYQFTGREFRANRAKRGAYTPGD